MSMVQEPQAEEYPRMREGLTLFTVAMLAVMSVTDAGLLPVAVVAVAAEFSFGAWWRTWSVCSCPGFSDHLGAVRRPDEWRSLPGQDRGRSRRSA